MQEEDKALQSTEGPYPDSRMAWRRLRMALEFLKSNIKPQTLLRVPYCQHSGVGRQSINICFRFNGYNHWEGPWAYMDCPAVDTAESSGSRPAAPSCSMDMVIWGDLGVIRIVRKKDCRYSGRFQLYSLADTYADCSGSNKSGNLQEEDVSLAHQRLLAQPDS